MEGITWANDILKNLGIRKYFERKVEKSTHANGVNFFFSFKPQYKDLFSRENYRSVRYNIYRGWEHHPKNITELLEFERGGDSKEAMGIGMREKIKQMMKEENWEYESDNQTLIWQHMKII